MTALAVVGVSIDRAGRSIVSNASFSVPAGSIVALMGESGTGKTTMLRAIAGLEALSAGRIHVPGRVGFVFQFHHLFGHLRAHQNVWLAPVHVARRPRADAERHSRELLDRLGVGHRADAYPQELSGGEAQRVAIARALAMDPALLLMDEPTASLDAGRRGELAATLRELASQGRAILMATHDAEFVQACADRTLVLAAGKIS